LRNGKYGKQLGAVMRKWLTNWAKGGYRYGKIGVKRILNAIY